jgi:hypothetical protein
MLTREYAPELVPLPRHFLTISLVRQSSIPPSCISRISFFHLEFSCSFLDSLLKSGCPDGQYGSEEDCDEKLER